MATAAHTRLLVIGLGAALFTARASASEADREQDPAAAYERAAELVAKGQDKRAAYFFARADSLKSSEVALTEALRAAIAGEVAALAMALAERADARSTKELARLSARAREKFAATTGRLTISCKAACDDLQLDGAPREALHGDWVSVGQHTVTWSSGGQIQERSVAVEAGGHERITLEAVAVSEPRPAQTAERRSSSAAPPPEQVDAAPDRSGMSPGWFYLGLGATAVLAGLTVASGIDTLNKNDEFKQNPDDDELKQSGEDAQLRTNLLLGAAVVAGVTSGLLGVFVVDWDGSRDRAAISVRGKF